MSGKGGRLQHLAFFFWASTYLMIAVRKRVPFAKGAEVASSPRPLLLLSSPSILPLFPLPSSFRPPLFPLSSSSLPPLFLLYYSYHPPFILLSSSFIPPRRSPPFKDTRLVFAKDAKPQAWVREPGA